MTVAECLQRIREMEPAVRAWVEVAPQPAADRGPLAGWPFGAKDIFETRGMATEYGSPLFAGRKGKYDAAIIAQLCQLGAVLLGKTHTTAFAYFDPAPTRNPHHLEHTPGGSSSGSAAAVACGMARFALGTQTAGSIIRPASYCGVTGFKPSFGVLPREGVLPFAPSLDTVGFFTRSAADLAVIWRALGHNVPDQAELLLRVPPRIPAVEDDMQAAFEHTLARLGASGVRIDPYELPADWQGMVNAVRDIQAYEGARSLEPLWSRHGERLGLKLADLIRYGLAMPESRYREALALLAEAAQRLRGAGFIATPAAPGRAPRGLASTGAPALNSPWTGTGRPAISLPMPVPGLPMGLQISADHGEDGALIALGCQIERILFAEKGRPG